MEDEAFQHLAEYPLVSSEHFSGIGELINISPNLHSLQYPDPIESDVLRENEKKECLQNSQHGPYEQFPRSTFLEPIRVPPDPQRKYSC